MLGDLEGCALGEDLGSPGADGLELGLSDGEPVGLNVPGESRLGMSAEGAELGLSLGLSDGEALGLSLGLSDGAGLWVGAYVPIIGAREGEPEGLLLGM